METFLIFPGNKIDLHLLKDKLESIGILYNLYSKGLLFRSNISSTRELYNKICEFGFDKLNVIVFRVNDIEHDGYWGFSERDTWNFLRPAQDAQ